MKYVPSALYVLVFAAANVLTAATVPADIGPFLVTWGTWVIGFTFVLRDLVQLAVGKAGAYASIGVALVVAAVTSALLGDTLAVVAGSVVAIGLSEAADTEVFSRLRARISTRIAVSGAVGSVLDSTVFTVVALSPLTSGIVPWELVPNVIAGQVLAKTAVQIVCAAAWRAFQRGDEVVPETV